MKKLVIFLSFALMLLTVGCQKEVIRPNCSDDSNSTSIYEKANANEEPNDDNNGKPDNPITDPNHDEDEDDKIKR
jgi:hypothetical protein